MLYELRVYHCMPGALPAVSKRFEEHTLGFFNKYGIRQAGFWTVAIGDSNQDLYYMLQWESLAERDTKWNAFRADADWHKVVAETEKNGPIVASITNQILQSTPFSSVK